CGGDQPRPVVPRPDRDAHARLRGREPGVLLRGELRGLRGGQEEAPRCRGAPADPHQVQAARPRLKRRRYFFAFFPPLEAGFASTFLAVILYVIVTLSPGFTSVLSSPRAISQFSLPFFTVIESAVEDTTGPVTWYVWSASAEAGSTSAEASARERKLMRAPPGVGLRPRTLRHPSRSVKHRLLGGDAADKRVEPCHAAAPQEEPGVGARWKVQWA